MPIPAHGEGEAQRSVLRGLRIAVELCLAVLIIEAFGAFFSRSLALTVDTVHNIPDLLAFAISYTALEATREGSSDEHTFGPHRLEVFAGILNGAVVLGAGAVFGYAAFSSLVTGSSFAGPVDPVWLLAAALPTLGLRAVSFRVFGTMPGRVRDLNLRSVIIHLASDIAITAVLVGAALALILRPNLAWIDPVAALVVAAILVYEAIPLLAEGWAVLNERVPRGISIEAISTEALGVPGVREIHDVHVWSVCSSLVCMTAHVQVDDMSVTQSMALVDQLRDRMETRFGILHTTFEVEGPRRERVVDAVPSAEPS